FRRSLRLDLRDRGCLRRRRRPAVPPLANARLLADAAAQVVQLGAADVADRRDLDLLDLGRVEREGPLDTHPERLLADGEGLARAGALSLDHDPLVDLDPAPLALDHLEMDADGIPGLE